MKTFFQNQDFIILFPQLQCKNQSGNLPDLFELIIEEYGLAGEKQNRSYLEKFYREKLYVEWSVLFQEILFDFLGSYL